MSRRRLRSFRPVVRRIHRRRFVGLCAGSLALAAASCRHSDDPAYTRGNTLVMAASSVDDVKPDVTDLDFLLFPRLAATDESQSAELEPRLAQRWEHSTDYREWTYHLRTDVRWSDGVPVTAHDVKFTLDLLSVPELDEWDFDSVTVLDDFTVRVRRPPDMKRLVKLARCSVLFLSVLVLLRKRSSGGGRDGDRDG